MPKPALRFAARAFSWHRDIGKVHSSEIVECFDYSHNGFNDMQPDRETFRTYGIHAARPYLFYQCRSALCESGACGNAEGEYAVPHGNSE